MQEIERRQMRPPRCGACFARIFHSEFEGQYLSATNFAPGLRKIAKGLIVEQQRAGRDGTPFGLYKIRTMRDDIPASELAKIKSTASPNPRVTRLGKILRKFWIDELPQLLNLVKGDLKLIGVRADSLAITYILPDEHRKDKQKFKPGLISIAYSDPSDSILGIIEAERKYLASYERAPYKTDFVYLFRFFRNVIFRGTRSS